MQDDSTNPAPASSPESPGLGKRRLLSSLFALLFVAFAAGGVFFGYIIVTTAADILGGPTEPPNSMPADGTPTDPSQPIVTIPQIPFLPNAAPSPTPVATSGTPVPGQTAKPAGNAAALPSSPTPTPEYLGKDRVTILLLGLDRRGVDRDTPTRSDTMILVTVDPVTKRAGVLSIPRDLWVAIPGHGENRINSAHAFGERAKTGGGPELARQTVELNFGVHVQYWARVDFRGFEELIDAVGGVTVDAQRAIKDDLYPTEDNGIRRIYIPTGIQHLTGAEALQFARSRHSENDFGRGVRQRQVLLAARQRILQPSVILKIPQLIGIARSSVETNIPLTEYIPLLNLARSVNTADIVSRSIEYSMTIDVNNDGTMLVPKREEVRGVVNEVFSVKPTPTPAKPAASAVKPTASAATPAAASSPRPQQIALRVLNGTNREGLAASWAERLRVSYRVTLVAQAPSSYQKTTILDHTGRPNAARQLIAALGLADAVVESAQAADDGADLTVILGSDLPVP